MKRLCIIIAVIPVMLLLAGCNQDPFMEEGTDVTLKEAAVPIPLKGEMCMISNEEDRIPVEGPIPGISLSRTASLNGNFTHMGKLKEESNMVATSAYLDTEALSQGKIVIVAIYEARLYSANGDYADLISPIRIDVTNKDQKIITGEFTFLGGSGKWENLAGGGTFSGIIPCWEVNGTLEFSKEI